MNIKQNVTQSRVTENQAPKCAWRVILIILIQQGDDIANHSGRFAPIIKNHEWPIDRLDGFLQPYSRTLPLITIIVCDILYMGQKSLEGEVWSAPPGPLTGFVGRLVG